jgi:uncharacterized membrane protein YphA (DoxX/SURF4 family)
MTTHSRADWGLLLLRVGLASLLIGLHGGPRLVRVFRYVLLGEPWTFVGLVEGLGLPFPLVFALLSTAADSIAAFFVGLGFLTRWASVMIAVNMTVAVYFETLGGDSPELPAVYLLGAAVLAVAGAGAYSVDAVRAVGKPRH